MPELPEVETIRSGLEKLIIGKTIKSITPLEPKSFQGSPADVKNFAINARIKDVRRRAKVLIIDLASGYSFVVHLKMTGQIIYDGSSSQDARFAAGHPNNSMISELPDKSTRVIIDFTDSSHLYFNDQRKFGWMRLLPTEEIKNISFMQKVGPEPLEDNFTWQDFKARFARKPRSKIKAALLDQSVIAGIGNIYADEANFYAKVHPARLVATLSDKEFKNLYEGARTTMKKSIEVGGSSLRNYVDSEGNRGDYLNLFAKVFHKEGQPCPRCGTEIIKIRVAGRGTHLCPHCQKL